MNAREAGLSVDRSDEFLAAISSAPGALSAERGSVDDSRAEAADYDGKIKGRKVRLWAVVCFQRVTMRIRNVRSLRAMCATELSKGILLRNQWDERTVRFVSNPLGLAAPPL